ncbi:deoxyguanosinetriphosphate triphosphohydrolase [Desulfosoma caldarium]|uniref:Deoxyguanosinetriphosphate triphosphohydrolase-like protein n=1 Tax=Desulfosoma caldarium TaxID=610254 RepID=A0A3N1VF56_9BACT|nr:deoxyguanosinetriphosphate triphosphohydrolase [Desulfosoma caldarium]ROR01506.1 dGTPase [Desulfosoma caldarium]
MPKGEKTARSDFATVRQWLEAREFQVLAPQAQKSVASQGRQRPDDPECPLRTAYQRDRDRIVHSKAFRRLKHKTQVFLSPSGDHYRTRLTHTLEVSQIARTIGRALALNEDLIEAVALGHDLGHTPFGHGGERVLSQLHPDGFRHHEQSLRVVDCLEKGGRGLNLTFEVRDGILKHSKGKTHPILTEPAKRPVTLEGQVVRVADIVAYVNHDLDDAIRARVLSPQDLPEPIRCRLGDSHAQRIHTLVDDVITASAASGLKEIRMSEPILGLVEDLRAFLFERVYELETIRQEFQRVQKILEDLYTVLLKDKDLFRREVGPRDPRVSRAQQVCDYIAGMTDRYALDLYKKIFLPRPWMRL